MTATHPKITATGLHRVCPMCGELLQSGRCPECSPIEPARSYSDRLTQPLVGAPPAISVVVDVRRTTGEWVAEAEEREPQTRRAHPTLVRTALAEAEERARDRAQRSEFVTRVASDTRPHYRPKSGRLRAVTPLPPEPTVAPPEPEPAAPLVHISRALAAANTTPEPGVTQRVPDLSVALPPRTVEARAVTPMNERPAYAEFDDVAPDNGRARLFWVGLAVAVGGMLVAAAI